MVVWGTGCLVWCQLQPCLLCHNFHPCQLGLSFRDNTWCMSTPGRRRWRTRIWNHAHSLKQCIFYKHIHKLRLNSVLLLTDLQLQFHVNIIQAKVNEIYIEFSHDTTVVLGVFSIECGYCKCLINVWEKGVQYGLKRRKRKRNMIQCEATNIKRNIRADVSFTITLFNLKIIAGPNDFQDAENMDRTAKFGNKNGHNKVVVYRRNDQNVDAILKKILTRSFPYHYNIFSCRLITLMQ